MRWKKSVLLVLACSVFCVACGKQEQELMMESLSDMRTECFGRHEVKMPKSYRFQHAGSSATFYFGHGVDFQTVDAGISREGLEQEKFADAVSRRAAEIAAEINEKTKGSMLIAQEEVAENTILLRYHRSDVSDRSHIHEVHRLVSGTHLFLKAESFGGDVEQVEARLESMAAGVEPVPGGGDGVDSGFCLGPLLFRPGNDYETATLAYRDAAGAHRDVALRIELGTFKRDESEARLAKRLERNFSGLGLRPNLLGKGALELAGMGGEQWKGRGGTGDQIEHLFVAESYPRSPSQGTPNLQVEMRTGGRLPAQAGTGLPPYRRSTVPASMSDERMSSSLSDAQAIALWDSIVASIRHR